MSSYDKTELLDHAGRARACKLENWGQEDLAHHCAFVESNLSAARLRIERLEGCLREIKEDWLPYLDLREKIDRALDGNGDR